MVPELHAQWRSLDLAELLLKGAAFVNMDSQNSILSPDGVLRHENIWYGARELGGSLHNVLRLAAACRALDMLFIWLRYDRFIGEREPKSAMDAAQYRAWNDGYRGDAARKAWECDLVDEVKEVMRPGDYTLVYPAWSIFTGTPLARTMIGPSPTMPPIGALPAPTILATSTPPRATWKSTSRPTSLK